MLTGIHQFQGTYYHARKSNLPTLNKNAVRQFISSVQRFQQGDTVHEESWWALFRIHS